MHRQMMLLLPTVKWPVGNSISDCLNCSFGNSIWMREKKRKGQVRKGRERERGSVGSVDRSKCCEVCWWSPPCGWGPGSFPANWMVQTIYGGVAFCADHTLKTTWSRRIVVVVVALFLFSWCLAQILWWAVLGDNAVCLSSILWGKLCCCSWPAQFLPRLGYTFATAFTSILIMTWLVRFYSDVRGLLSRSGGFCYYSITMPSVFIFYCSMSTPKTHRCRLRCTATTKATEVETCPKGTHNLARWQTLPTMWMLMMTLRDQQQVATSVVVLHYFILIISKNTIIATSTTLPSLTWTPLISAIQHCTESARVHSPQPVRQDSVLLSTALCCVYLHTRHTWLSA